LVFTIAPSGGVTPYSYQWQLNGSSISGATLNTYDPPNLTAVGSYTYNCVVTDACASTASTSPKVITIVPDPSVSISANSSVCLGSNLALNSTVTNGVTIAYEWQSSTASAGPFSPIGGATSSTYNPLTSSAGTLYYRLRIPNNGSCNQALSNVISVTVNAPPSCSITGNNGICPSTTNSYSATAGMTSYTWSISGSGTISGSATASSVSVVAGSTCGTYTLNVTITDANTCTSSCSQTFNITDNTPPTFTGNYTTVALGCNPATPSGSLGTATATDACGAVTITSSDGSVVSNVCNRSLTRTFTARDACNNTATTSRTVTWTDDLTPPTFTGSYVNVPLGCNPATPSGSLGTATATDACGAITITSSDGSVVSSGCDRSHHKNFYRN
jgi:hypothetical protein